MVVGFSDPRRELLADLTFTGRAIEWRGPAPHVFVPIPPELTGEIRYAARAASYGWGVVPVEADVAGLTFTTALFPRDGDYLLPLKLAVRRPLGLAAGDAVDVMMRIYAATAVRK